MRNIILLLSLTLLIVFNNPIYSQNDKFPENKYKDGHTFNSIFKKPKKLKKASISYGSHKTYFLNSSFYQHIKDGIIQRKFGGVFKFQQIIYPFIIDADWFSSKYILNGNYGLFPDNINIRQHGLSLFCSATFPALIKSNIFFPYIGIGYQASALETGHEIYGKAASEPLSNFNTSAPMWKIGFDLKLYQLYFLAVEYRQTLMLNNDKSFNQLAILLGINFSR